MRRKIDRACEGTVKPGQELVAAGFAGRAGAALIAKAREEELTEHFSRLYVESIYNYKEVPADRNLEQWRPLGATEREMAGEGGILAALWNLLCAYGVGGNFTLRQIPVTQETIEICEYYNLNPYRLYSENCVILVTDNGGRLVKELEKEGICAAVIGSVLSGVKIEIQTAEGTAYLERPSGDEIEKVKRRQKKIYEREDFSGNGEEQQN